MKKAVWTLGLLFLLPNSSLAQETTQFYYPLNDGDVFQYHFDFGSTFVGIHTRTVGGDTLMPNGKIYKKLESDFVGFFSTQYVRVADGDSVFRYLHPNETLLFPLNLSTGLTWSVDEYAFHEISDIRDTTLFGGSFQIAEMATLSSLDSTLLWALDFLLADTLGVIYDLDEGGGEQLTGAIIDGRQFGVIKSFGQSADSLKAFYPLQIDDYWEYAIGLPNANIRAWRHVKKDTLMDNGYTYSVIISDDNYNHDFADTVYERVTDDFEVRRYFSNAKGSGEQLLFKLDAEMGDTWISSDSILTNQVKLDTVFSADFLTTVRIHKSYQTTFTGFEILAHELGFVRSRDEFLDGGSLFLEGAIINGTMYGNVTSVNSKEKAPTIFDFRLFQNYPNPFNGGTTIAFEHTNIFPEQVRLSVYNVFGQEIITLVDEVLPAGRYSAFWNGTNRNGKLVASNIYIARLTIGSIASSKRITFIK